MRHDLFELPFLLIASIVNLLTWQLQQLPSRTVRKLLGLIISMEWPSRDVRWLFMPLNAICDSSTSFVTLWSYWRYFHDVAVNRLTPLIHSAPEWADHEAKFHVLLFNDSYGHSYVVTAPIFPISSLITSNFKVCQSYS